MSLENVLKTLEMSIKGRLSEVDEDILQDKEVRSVLTTCFAEREARPELTSLIRAPSLMYEYLNLDLEEREELDGFRENNPNYLQGEGEELKGRPISVTKNISEKTLNFIKKQRYTVTFLKMFDFYLKNRKEGEIFNSNYLCNNNELKDKFYSLGMNVLRNIRSNLGKEGFSLIMKLAAEIEQRINSYSNRREVRKIDCRNQLLSIFDFYLENQEKKELFNLSYLLHNKQLEKSFGNLGRRIVGCCRRNFFKDGGVDYFIQMVARERPEIIKHWNRRNKYDLKKQKFYIDQFLEIFEFFLKHRKAGMIFNPSYFQRNKQLKKKFGNLPQRIYENARIHLEAGFPQLVTLATETNPEIKKYITYTKALKVDGVQEFIHFFDFYLENRKEEDIFNLNYFERNKRLKNKFGSRARNMVRRIRYNFKDEDGINYIIQQVAQQRPEILEHWRYSPKREYTRKES